MIIHIFPTQRLYGMFYLKQKDWNKGHVLLKQSLNISVGRKANSQRKLWADFLSGHMQLYIRRIIVIIQLI